MEGFFSFKILAEKVNNFIVTLKNLLHEENIMINLSDIISIIKRSKLYLSQKDNLIDLNQKSQGVFYNDKEFNQENDIKQAELNAIAKELRCFLSKKIELNKIAIDKQFKNSKEILEKLLEKIFGPLKTNKLIEEQGINKY